VFLVKSYCILLSLKAAKTVHSQTARALYHFIIIISSKGDKKAKLKSVWKSALSCTQMGLKVKLSAICVAMYQLQIVFL